MHTTAVEPGALKVGDVLHVGDVEADQDDGTVISVPVLSTVHGRGQVGEAGHVLVTSEGPLIVAPGELVHRVNVQTQVIPGAVFTPGAAGEYSRRETPNTRPKPGFLARLFGNS